MTIGVDIRVLARGGRTGVEEYTINLLARLLRLDPRIKFKLFLNSWHPAQVNFNWFSLPNVQLCERRIPNRFLFASAKYLGYPKIDRLIGGADIFFSPHFFNAPVSGNCKKVMMFHDLSFEYFPEFFSWKKRLWQKYLIDAKSEAKKADRIVVNSQSTKQDLVDLYKIKPEKIEVVYLGIGEEFRKIEMFGESIFGGSKEGRRLLGVKSKYNLPDKFILYFGTIEPRKNLVGLIRAFELFKEKNVNSDFSLVFAGGKGWLFEEVFRAAKESRFSSEIVFTDFVEPDDKVYLYNLASLFVYPSFFEGFGFPPLEAMACGVPAITSFSSSMPEVVGDAALMVDPYNIEKISWAIGEVLNDAGLARDLIKKGFGQAKKFSWDKCARETLKLLISN